MIQKNNKDTELLSCYLKKGEEAEKRQLPCYLPYSSNNKIALKNYLEIFSKLDGYSKSSKQIKTLDPNRNMILNEHRKGILEFKKFSNSDLHFFKTSIKPPKTQKTSKDITNFKRILLQDIDTRRDHVMNGFILGVTLIDLSLTGMSSVHFVVADDHGDVERLSIYNLGTDYVKIRKQFEIGTKFDIINPYMRLSADNSFRIRVDDTKSIVFTGKVRDICRFCSAAQSTFKCGRCKQAIYCSKECQNNDWKLANHKLICD